MRKLKEKLSASSDISLIVSGILTEMSWMRVCYLKHCAMLPSDRSYSEESMTCNLEIRSLKGLSLLRGITRISVNEEISVFCFPNSTASCTFLLCRHISGLALPQSIVHPFSNIHCQFISSLIHSDITVLGS